MDSRYHLSTLEIVSWAKKQKIFFKHLKALCNEISEISIVLNFIPKSISCLCKAPTIPDQDPFLLGNPNMPSSGGVMM